MQKQWAGCLTVDRVEAGGSVLSPPQYRRGLTGLTGPRTHLLCFNPLKVAGGSREESGGCQQCRGKCRVAKHQRQRQQGRSVIFGIVQVDEGSFFVGLPLHYRLRCPIGFLNVQKKSKSKGLFLTQGTPKYDNFSLFVKIMTQILYQKYFITFSESKYGQNHGQCSEKVEGGLSGG